MYLLTSASPDLAVIRSTGLVMLAAGLFCAFAAPSYYWLLIVSAGAAAGLLLAWRYLPAATAIWLLVTGASLEMALLDLIGPAAFAPTIAAVKGAGVLLAVLAALRYGPRLDILNPALAWVAMFVAGWGHGLWPGLSPDESLRSLAGSVAPYVFGFSRLSRSWAEIIVRITRWIPTLVVAAGAALAITGLRPLFVDSGGARLGGLGHPAFLAAVCQTAGYAALIQYYRQGRNWDLFLLALNLVLLILTGARAPLTYSAGVAGLTLLLVHSPAVPRHRRVLLILTGLAMLALVGAGALIWAEDIGIVRLFQVLQTEAGNLSGREMLWPSFEDAASRSPWFGWGVGAGNLIIPPQSSVAELLHTRAAHNEYLRIGAEGGEVGRALLIVWMFLWVRGHTRILPPAERSIMRLIFIALAAHAATDNVLISTPACVLFTFAIAVFTRGRLDAEVDPSLKGNGREG